MGLSKIARARSKEARLEREKWKREAKELYPRAWVSFRIHYSDSSIEDELFWKVFLTGYLAGGNDKK